MSFFNLKLAISGNTFIDPFVKSEKISCIDTKISKKLSKFEYDSEEANKLRSNTRNELLKLERAMTQVDSVDLPSYEKTCLKDIRVYEKALRKQVKDILQIILQLKKLIENEYLEIIYDLRNPLRIFEHFVQQIKNITMGLEVKKTVGKEIEKIFAEIEASYSKLIDYTFNFIESEFKYYNSIGLNFKSFHNALETDYAFSTHLKNRSKIKQQINGKTQWIKSQIDRLEGIFKDLSKKRILDKNESQAFLQSTNCFREQFDGLITFGIKRVDVANHMIIEAIVIQKDKHNELEGLKKELKQFYSEFIQDQEKLQSGTESKWVTEQTKKRIMEFKNYEKEMEKEFSELEKEFTLLIDKVEKEDIEEQRIEKKELKKIEGFFPKFKRNFKRAVATGMLGLASVGYASPPDSFVGTVKDVLRFGIEHIDSQYDLAKKFLEGDIDEIQKKINMMDTKIREGQHLTKKEISYVRGVVNAMRAGGICQGMFEASQMLNQYWNGKGGEIKIGSNVYEECPAVQDAMKRTADYIIKKFEAGEIKEKGHLQSNKIMRGNSRDQDLEESGIMNNGYIKAGRSDSERLFYFDRRFRIDVDYEINGNDLKIKYTVKTKYDFEDHNESKKVTPLPIPNSSKKLRLPHSISKYAHKRGFAHEFTHIATWTSSHKLL